MPLLSSSFSVLLVSLSVGSVDTVYGMLSLPLRGRVVVSTPEKLSKLRPMR
jgi:hypothetical protein